MTSTIWRFHARQRHKRFWAFDSEFLMSGRANRPEDVHSVQFSCGEGADVIESAPELKAWLKKHRNIKTMYGFVVLPDLASIEEWLGKEYVSYKRRGVQLIGLVKYAGAKIRTYDARPLLSSFGLRKLADCGKAVGVPKLPKPDWLGLRKWHNNREHEDFTRYAAQDAIITSRIVRWLWEKCGADPEIHTSAGTLARDIFQLPKRLKRIKKTVHLSPLERQVKNACYAGRSEGFTTGFTHNVTYNDVKSLYPTSVFAARALQIVGAEPCDFSDLEVSNDLNDMRYGWVQGVFEAPESRWAGLPLRGKNNFYATGVIQGFYHTFDLAASKAEIIEVSHCYKPLFSGQPKIHDQYAEMYIKRVEGDMNKSKAMRAKAILNSLTGKLGQAKPHFARTSNFFAYSTLLAHSHLIMSCLFDKSPTRVLAMDTDSIFTQSDMSGKWFEVTDGERSISAVMDVKGQGDLAFFRSKNYLLRQRDGTFVYGRHGWQYWLEDFLKLFDGATELHTRQDIKHTLLTRQKEAQKMTKGRWRTKPKKLNLAKLKSLLEADFKRKRVSYDSYQLVLDRKNQHSQPWNYEWVMTMRDDLLNFPKLLVGRLTSKQFQRQIGNFMRRKN